MPKELLKAYRKAYHFLRTRVFFRSTSAPQPPPNSLPGLPTEIKQAILSSLADVASLRALILTCSTLYQAFLDVKSLTIANIIQTQIDSSLMQDALTTLRFSRITPCSKSVAENLRRAYIRRETSFSVPRWTLRDTLDLSELHSHVEFFARIFASSALSHNPVTGLPKTGPVKVSPSELIRIERTLYRFEFYHTSFAEREEFSIGRTQRFTENFTGQDRARYLYAGFAPWENEQLACIRDYLDEVLSTCMCPFASAFDEFESLINLALNDAARPLVGQVLRRTLFGGRKDPAGCLSLGLAFLHRIILAKTYNERYQLLSRRRLAQEDSLHAALEDYFIGTGRFRRLPLSDLTEAQQRLLIRRQVADDDDHGPKDAWYWAHVDCASSDWCNTRERKHLRRWGYVMWDYARLAEWMVLDKDWRTLPRLELEPRSSAFSAGLPPGQESAKVTLRPCDTTLLGLDK